MQDYASAALRPVRPAASAWSAAVSWAVILLVVGTLAALTARAERRPAKPLSGTAAVPPADIQMVLSGRIAIGFGLMMPMNRANLRPSVEQAAQQHPADRLRAAVVAAELGGPKDALSDLDTAAPVVAVNARLRADAAALRRVYAADTAAVLTDTERAALVTDLGYFGQLAVTRGRPADDPDRRVVLAQARRTAVTVIVGLVVLGGGLLLGLALFVLAIVLVATGTVRAAYRPSTAGEPAGRPVWLEGFAVWMAVFAVGSLGLALLHLPRPLLAGEGLLTGVTALSVGWAAWRGRLSGSAVRRALGWDVGRGVLTEVGLGVAGYVAGLPVVAVGLVAAGLLGKLAGVQATHPIVNEFHAGMGLKDVAVLLLVASVAAPVLEETMFRGALYAHLRRRHAAWVSAAVVALLFAAIHPQGWTAVPVLGSIALVLAALREWRGSLIAPMTAHALNNGVAVCLMAAAVG